MIPTLHTPHTPHTTLHTPHTPHTTHTTHHTPHTHHTPQLALSLGYATVSYTEQLMRWVREFNITVETIEHLFPQLKPKVDDIFYNAKSLILAFNSESIFCLNNFLLMFYFCSVLLPMAVYVASALSVFFLFYMVQQHQ